jgi:hypothetical protein
MMLTRSILPNGSNVDTVLTLPEQTGAFAMAFACREAALSFVNESERWGKAELAMWLMGPYSQCTQHVTPIGQRDAGARPVPLLREIDARMVERMVRTARLEVLDTLARLTDPESGASFAFATLASGFVVRCEDRHHVAGWAPTTAARRLADRVLSLVAADYLTGRGAYESTLSLCPVCQSVDFDSFARGRGLCHRHGSGFLLSRPRRTLPYVPEGA